MKLHLNSTVAFEARTGVISSSAYTGHIYHTELHICHATHKHVTECLCYATKLLLTFMGSYQWRIMYAVFLSLSKWKLNMSLPLPAFSLPHQILTIACRLLWMQNFVAPMGTRQSPEWSWLITGCWREYLRLNLTIMWPYIVLNFL